MQRKETASGSLDFSQLLDTFPDVDLAIAYGSGVFQQQGYEDVWRSSPGQHQKELPMIDMIFSVSEPETWHRQNMEINVDHYNGVGLLGSKTVSWVQEAFGAGIYYNTLVPMPLSIRGLDAPRQYMKYGVISSAALLDDLHNWKTLYVAGRLHKPVHVIKCVDDSFRHAMDVNLRHALTASLLLLPQQFTLEELFMTIASLSYTGDFRMIVGENPDKVRNIVATNAYRMLKLYRKPMKNCPQLKVPASILEDIKCLESTKKDQQKMLHTKCQQNTSVDARLQLFFSLPSWVRNSVSSTQWFYDESHRAHLTPSRSSHIQNTHRIAQYSNFDRLRQWRRSRVGVRDTFNQRMENRPSRRPPAFRSGKSLNGPGNASTYSSGIPYAATSDYFASVVRQKGDEAGPLIASLLKPTIARVVGRGSRGQAFKGIMSAGISKTVIYSLSKVKKQLKALTKIR